MSVWNNGRVYFNSPTMKKAIGDYGIGPDVLNYCLEAGK